MFVLLLVKLYYTLLDSLLFIDAKILFFLKEDIREKLLTS